ncbi:MAG: DUF3343 domain-containing protein [Oscillospiraceae bacterium]|nr:DUF3343 domain-containing protein [Oscillospiraceae bacterium]
MLHYLLTCRSLTYAQSASRALERTGITAIITKAPKSAAGRGCAYCVKVAERHLVKAISAFKDAGLGPPRVLLVSHDGAINEVGE